MTQFTYQAKNQEGKIYEKTVEAVDRLALYSVIREEGGTVVSIRETKPILPSFNMSFSFSFLNGIKTQEKISLAKNLSSMIEAGLSVTRALSVMSRQTKRKPLQALISDLEENVSRGKTLSEALALHPKVFSPLFASMVKAGEESGGIASSLKIVGSQMEKSYQLVKKVRGAMIYPSVVIGVMVVLAILLLIFMVPTLTQTFEGLNIELPLSTRTIIFFSNFLINNLLLTAVFLFFFVILTTLFFRSPSGRRFLDSASLKLPVVGNIVREVETALMARTLSSLLSAGVDVVVALAVTSDVMQNHLYKESMQEAKDKIQKGEQLSVLLGQHSYIYPLFVSEMALVGEETGKIADMLANAATYYENEVDQKTKDLSTIIEPLLMVIIGIGVGFFAISMLAPTYSLADHI